MYSRQRTPTFGGGATKYCYYKQPKYDAMGKIYRKEVTYNRSYPGLTMNGNHTEMHTRQRMRPWLESRIDSREIPGLEWIDRNEKIFKVPWKHVGNREWKDRDSQIFKEWAVHTGRFREGVDMPDWPTWKTRFRCALNKLPDIQEIKELGKLEGTEPYRTYKFLPRQVPGSDRTPNLAQSSTLSHTNVPTMVPGLITPVDELDDLDRIPTDDLVHPADEPMEQGDPPVPLSPGSDIEFPVNHDDFPVHFKRDVLENNLTAYMQNGNLEDHHMYINIKYRQQTMVECHVQRRSGCHFSYGPTDLTKDMDPNFNEEMYGTRNAEMIQFPPANSGNIKQDELTMQLLKVLDRGVCLYMQEGDIYAKRKCRCTIFVSSPSCHGGETSKLIRDEPTRLFDYQNYFKPALERYMHSRGPKPSAEFVLGFGQKFGKDETTSNLLISVTVFHMKAFSELTKISCTSPMSPPIQISRSDDYDRYLAQIRHGHPDHTDGRHGHTDGNPNWT